MLDLPHTVFNETVALEKYLNVFNNHLQLDVQKLDSFKYEPNDLLMKDPDKKILVIKDVQRLKNDLNITLKSDATVLNISLPPQFKLSMFFRNI